MTRRSLMAAALGAWMVAAPAAAHEGKAPHGGIQVEAG